MTDAAALAPGHSPSLMAMVADDGPQALWTLRADGSVRDYNMAMSACEKGLSSQELGYGPSWVQFFWAKALGSRKLDG